MENSNTNSSGNNKTNDSNEFIQLENEVKI